MMAQRAVTDKTSKSKESFGNTTLPTVHTYANILPLLTKRQRRLWKCNIGAGGGGEGTKVPKYKSTKVHENKTDEDGTNHLGKYQGSKVQEYQSTKE
jgi:hypothetical protein